MSQSRIAYLLKKFPRLSETFVLNEILEQERLGRDLHIFSRRRADDEPRHPQLERLRAEVETLPPRSELDPWRLLFEGDWAPEMMFSAVGRMVRASRDWGHPRFSPLLCEALYLLGRTRALGIQHVHTHFATDSALVAMILHDLGGPSYSLTAHAKDIYRSSVNPKMLSRMFAGAEFVVTVCDANVRFLEQRIDEPARTRLRRLYNGVDLEVFSPAQRSRAENHVLAVGRLVEKKGFHVLVEAIAKLRDGGRDVRCTIVGEGDERPRLESLIQERQLASRVELVGALDQNAVREYLALATVLCQPCVIGADGNRDALPTVLLEALAVGLPAISTPVTGIPEILDEGSAGLIVPENDVAATAEALLRLLDSPEERLRLARAGRVRARRYFNARVVATTLHDWIDAAIAARGVPCESPV